jgi:hypothetical protein
VQTYSENGLCELDRTGQYQYWPSRYCLSDFLKVFRRRLYGYTDGAEISHCEDGGSMLLRNGCFSLCPTKCPNPEDFGIIGRDIVALVRNPILVSLIAHMQEDFA